MQVQAINSLSSLNGIQFSGKRDKKTDNTVIKTQGMNNSVESSLAALAAAGAATVLLATACNHKPLNIPEPPDNRIPVHVNPELMEDSAKWMTGEGVDIIRGTDVSGKYLEKLSSVNALDGRTATIILDTLGTALADKKAMLYDYTYGTEEQIKSKGKITIEPAKNVTAVTIYGSLKDNMNGWFVTRSVGNKNIKYFVYKENGPFGMNGDGMLHACKQNEDGLWVHEEVLIPGGRDSYDFPDGVFSYQDLGFTPWYYGNKTAKDGEAFRLFIPEISTTAGITFNVVDVKLGDIYGLEGLKLDNDIAGTGTKGVGIGDTYYILPDEDYLRNLLLSSIKE